MYSGLQTQDSRQCGCQLVIGSLRLCAETMNEPRTKVQVGIRVQSLEVGCKHWQQAFWLPAGQ